MVERLSALGQPFSMHYCTRSAGRTAFRERIRRSRLAPAVRFHFDDGGAEQKLDIPALLCTPQAGMHEYTCGLKGFMDAVLSTARRSGWPEAAPLRLAAQGVHLPTSCDQGVCGTCLTRVLEGEPDHGDLYPSPEEQAANDQFLPCCSRARTATLVLDL